MKIHILLDCCPAETRIEQLAWADHQHKRFPYELVVDTTKKRVNSRSRENDLYVQAICNATRSILLIGFGAKYAERRQY